MTFMEIIGLTALVIVGHYGLQIYTIRRRLLSLKAELEAIEDATSIDGQVKVRSALAKAKKGAAAFPASPASVLMITGEIESFEQNYNRILQVKTLYGVVNQLTGDVDDLSELAGTKAKPEA